ncbi:MAG: RidA family protein [Pseudomonadota bacterium]
MKRAVTPAAFRESAAQSRMSPGIVCNDFVFLTGVTGSAPDGAMPEDPETQFRAAFGKLAGTLAETGLGLDAIVEMTSYHIGLRGHFDLFDAVRVDLFSAPYPAWTAIEAGGLRRQGAIVEIRATAYAGTQQMRHNLTDR